MTQFFTPGVDPVDPVAACEEIGESMSHWYVNHTVEDIYKRLDNLCSPEDLEKCKNMIKDLASHEPKISSEEEFNKVMVRVRRTYKCVPRKAQLLHAYNILIADGTLQPMPPLRAVLTQKAMKSQSGIISITVLTSPYPSVPGQEGPPQRFSCKWDCHYCPNQPGQPRSYLRDEPAVRRANQNRFDPVLQFTDRATVISSMGHPVDKVEVLVLGGTWHSYPIAYQEGFCRDIFYAANTFLHRGDKRRAPRSLEEEQDLNESAQVKIIGLTLETRPDCIHADELRRLRRYGCTRVQLGVQHVDDGILQTVNRGHDCFAVEEALRLLKDSCYKIDIHLMPNLPGASPKVDRDMFWKVLSDENLQADQWKIYPCEVTPWTRIKQWYEEGKYKPYSEEEVLELLAEVKPMVHPWIRLNRVIRDIPDTYIIGGLETTNLREHILAIMRQRGKRCRCIRCREIGDLGGWEQSAGTGVGASVGGRQNRDGPQAQRKAAELAAGAMLVERYYPASGGEEYFLSFETDTERLFGFCRLRLAKRGNYPPGLFPELEGCALVRELHVYGQLAAATVQSGQGDKRTTQHSGFGSLLMRAAERKAWDNGFRAVAVISGVGVRNYYRRLGYEVAPGEGGFMIKRLTRRPEEVPVGKRVIGGRWRLWLARVRLQLDRWVPMILALAVMTVVLLLLLWSDHAQGIRDVVSRLPILGQVVVTALPFAWGVYRLAPEPPRRRQRAERPARPRSLGRPKEGGRAPRGSGTGPGGGLPKQARRPPPPQGGK
eukprot:Hpha_TRINITY_DN4964_c0_g1::TRINITY_DN4964_c0_g1_i1::g.51408::m.51408